MTQATQLPDLKLMEWTTDGYASRSKEESRCPIRLSALGQCPRSIARQLSGSERIAPDARAQRIFEMGHARGEALADALVDGMLLNNVTPYHEVEFELWLNILGIERPAEVFSRLASLYGMSDLPVRVNYDGAQVLQVRGRADLILFWSPEPGASPKWADLIEYKTKNSFGFDKLDAEGPGVEYSCQVSGYAEALEQLGLVVRSTTFIFENKDTCELKTIPFNRKLFDPTYRERLDMLAEAINKWNRGDPTAGDPIHVTNLLTQQVEGGPIKGYKLPWNCNYCAVGPEAGECAPIKMLRNKQRPTDAKPKWEIVL